MSFFVSSNILWLKYILSNIRIAFFIIAVCMTSFPHPLTFYMFVSLTLKCVSCRKLIVVSCSFTYSDSLCLLIELLDSLTFNVITIIEYKCDIFAFCFLYGACFFAPLFFLYCFFYSNILLQNILQIFFCKILSIYFLVKPFQFP